MPPKRKKRPPKKKAPPRAKPSRNGGTTTASSTGSNGKAASIRIRMYRVGFGDCFLVTLAGQHHILVDCGVHSKGNIRLNGDSLIDKAFQNIEEETGKNLAIVIATHAHQDHVSGYGKFADQFGQFSIREVWMPWTEDASNPTAKSWHDKRARLVAQLRADFAAVRDVEALAATENAVANPKAMEALHSGFGGKATVRYLKASDQLNSPAGLTGLSAKILGPPEDPAFISKMNPPASDEYLRMAASQGTGRSAQPFPNWELPPARLLPEWQRLNPSLLKLLTSQGQLPARAVAFSLDKLLNNTSIVALFSWAGKQMLFPGDAQYGDWAYWYKSTGPAALSDICFYKVAHHGSQNATPKGALAEMPQGKFAAMVSTQNKPWPSIPRKPLLEAVDERTNQRLVRSDSLAVQGAPNGPALPQPLPLGFTQGQLSKGEYWIDYNIA